MLCDKCGNKKIELLTSWVCDTCDPPGTGLVEVGAEGTSGSSGALDKATFGDSPDGAKHRVIPGDPPRWRTSFLQTDRFTSRDNFATGRAVVHLMVEDGDPTVRKKVIKLIMGLGVIVTRAVRMTEQERRDFISEHWGSGPVMEVVRWYAEYRAENPAHRVPRQCIQYYDSKKPPAY